MKSQTFANKFIAQSIEESAWKELSSSEELPWSQDLIATHRDKWDWDRLSNNSSIKWSVKMIDRFSCHIVWANLTCTLFYQRWHGMDLEYWQVEDLLKFIEKFEEKWDWEVISEQIDTPYIEAILDKFPQRVIWQKVAYNSNIKWSVELFNKYESQLSNVDEIKETSFWESLTKLKAGHILSQIMTDELK